MRICGLQKLTLLDYPGKTACTVFTGGCNFRCPFCQNTPLVLRPGEEPDIGEESFLAFLEKRQGLLDGVVVSGGEPTLQPELPDFLQKIKALGYAVKLDTNGGKPEVLASLLDSGLVDYVAMDIKNSPEKYALTAGVPELDLAPIRESAALLLERGCGEFRTTVVQELHTPEDMAAIGSWLTGAERYFIQNFRDSGDILSPGLHPCTKDQLQALLDAVRAFLPGAQVRGEEDF